MNRAPGIVPGHWRAWRPGRRLPVVSAGMLLAVSAPLHAASYSCLIEPAQVVELAPPVGGVIERVLVKRGDRVSRGQVVAQLDSRAEKAGAALALYRSKMEGPTELAQKKIEASTRKYERRRDMAAERLMPRQESDDAEAELKLARAELRSASESREAARLEYLQQTTQLGMRTIRSPFNGVVADQMLWPGEVVQPGTGKQAILKLAQVNPLRVRVVLPMRAFREPAMGMTAMVAPEILPGQVYRAKVSSIDRIIDAASGTFVVFLDLPNPKLDLPSGVRCRTSFVAQKPAGKPAGKPAAAKR